LFWKQYDITATHTNIAINTVTENRRTRTENNALASKHNSKNISRQNFYLQMVG